MKKYYKLPEDIILMGLRLNEVGNTIEILGNIPFTLRKIKKLTDLRMEIRNRLWSEIGNFLNGLGVVGKSELLLLEWGDENYGCVRVNVNKEVTNEND